MHSAVDYSKGSSRNFYIDGAAISVRSLIMVGMVVLGFPIWFQRCCGPDCEFCYRYHQMSFERRLLMEDDVFQHMLASDERE